MTRPGAGTFVAEQRRPVDKASVDTNWQLVPLGDRFVDASRLATILRPAPEGVISLAAGYAHPQLMPMRALTSSVSRAARRPDVWERPPPAGIRRLREWFARTSGDALTADDVLITGGGQSALSAAFRALLPPGAPILVESPTYLGALAVGRAAGLRPVPVPVDEGGVQLDMLAEAFSATGARAFYCQPTFQNPTGAVLAPERRAELLAIASAAGAFVIEDDHARLLPHEHPAPPPLASIDQQGRVVYVASLTKPTSPNLRIGALIARGPIAERLRSLRVVDDFFPSRLLQEAALELVESSAWPRHLATLSSSLTARRRCVTAAVARELPLIQVPLVPRGGMHLWLRLPDGVDDTVVAEAAERSGVLVTPGRPCFAAEPPGAYLRLTFSGVAGLPEIEEGVRRLGSAFASQADGGAGAA